MDHHAPQKRRVNRKSKPSALKELTSSPSPSPPQRRKKAGKRSHQQKTKEEKIWRLDEPAVLREEDRADGCYLLLNWADIDPATGKKYEPTWEKDTVAAIVPWKGSQGKETDEQDTEGDEEEQQHTGRIPNSQENKASRPAKRKRLVRQGEITSRGQAEKRRRLESSTTATGATQSEQILEPEIHDTFEEEEPSSNRQSGPELRVEISVPEDFDRSLYAVALFSAQSSPQVEDSGVGRETIHSASRNSEPRRRPLFIWDEDPIVPDSVEQTGSSSYKASSSAHTRTSLPKDSGHQSISQNSPNSLGLGATQSVIGDSRSQSVTNSLAEPQSFLAQASYRIPESSQNSSSSQVPEHIPGRTSRSRICSPSQDSRVASRQIDASLPDSTTQFSRDPISSQSSPRQDIWQHFNNPNSVYSGSQLSSQYFSQLPFSPPPLSGSLNFEHANLLDQSQQLPSNSEPKHSHPDREDTPRNTSVARSVVPQNYQSSSASQAAPASFEATWAAVKVISSAPEKTRLPINSPPLLSLSPNKLDPTSQGLSKSIENSAPADTGKNSQQAQSASKFSGNQSKSSDAYHSQSSHLPSPPSEDILPSIEDPPGNNSPTRHVTPQSSEFIGASSPNEAMSTSSSMDPSVKQEEAPFDSKTALKQAMEARRMKIREEQRERDRTLSTASPSPAINILETTVHQAVAAELRVPVVQEVADDTTIPNDVDEQTRDSHLTSDLDQPSTSLDVLPTRSNEFLVPLPMISLVRNVYHTTIHDHKSLIKMFIRGDSASFEEEKIEEIDGLLENLRRICDHQDTLNDGSSTQQSSTSTPMNTAEQAQWAENCSTKCIFLVSFLVRMKSQSEHIVIVARPGMIHILQEICQYHGINYNRTPPNNGFSSLRVTLYPTGEQATLDNPPTIVIAFGCDRDDFKLLTDLRTNTDAPLISLVINHSIEHLDRCFTDEIDPLRKRVILLRCLQQLENSMGQMKDHPFEEPAVAANSVAEYFENGAFPSSWPLTPMPEIDGIEMTPDPQSHPNQESSSGMVKGSHNPPEVAFQSGLKRQIEDSMVTGSPKRQRLTPAPGDTALDMEISHISSSAQQCSATQPDIASQSSKAASQSNSKGRISSLLNRIKDLEMQFQEKIATEARLRELNNELEAGRKDLMGSIERITPKYQEALNERGQFEHDIKQALLREAAANKRIAAQAAEIIKLKEKDAATTKELSEARQALSSSTIPGVAEVANLKNELAKLKADNERLQKSASSLQKQAEYMRINYQNASTAAAEATAEAQELQATNAELKAKADSNVARIHEVQRDSDLSAHLSTIKRLRSEKEDLERECDRRGEELKAYTNKRVSGRRTPVPRSPRIGGAMSPGPIRNAGRNFRAGSAGGSRGNSPAPGDVFGGNLDGSAVRGGSVRWGTHLQ